MYNLTNVTGTEGILGLFKVANQITSDWFGIMFLLGIFLIALVAMISRNVDGKHAFATSSFITLIMTILLRSAEIVMHETVYIAVIVLTVFAFVALFASKDRL